MYKLIKTSFLIIVLMLCALFVFAQGNNYSRSAIISRDSITRGDYTLIFINKDSAFDPRTGKKLINAFFTVYPKLAQRFNSKTAKKVTFVISPEYGGPAGTSNNIVTYGAAWLQKRPDDIDIVTHEVMHIIQNYPSNSGPGWLTEGIADYVRYKFGVDNAGGGWSLTPFDPNHSYKNSYRITARFLAWLENHVRATIVNELDIAMRSRAYTENIWKELTGQSLDELWSKYALDPAL